MARSTGNCIADSLQLSLGYAERLLKDIPAESFGRFATVGGETVNSNHPAFILGHLSLYPIRILRELGQDPADATTPENYEELFSDKVSCQDDVDGTLYPPMEEIKEYFFKGYGAALEKLRAADDEIFLQDNPAEGRLKELFPSIGSMHAFYVGGHVMVHLGQLSAWRRMQGMGPA
ncbi:DinB family protein [Thalassoglobus sp.]|uniref:DinB family protein n=1 Tax=Thalassoglobus sp. TaxID=2795869 RepID=UPI003AA84562